MGFRLQCFDVIAFDVYLLCVGFLLTISCDVFDWLTGMWLVYVGCFIELGVCFGVLF